ncbi:MAG: hypothetical protein WC314_25645 [Vulcanimicrobiota bacterium]
MKKILKRACDLSRDQLERIVEQVQVLLFVEEDENEELVFTTEKEQKSGADFIGAVTEIFELEDAHLIPSEKIPYTDPPKISPGVPTLAIVLGGFFTQVVTDDLRKIPPLNILTIDYDVEEDDKEELTGVPQGDGTVVNAFVARHTIQKARIDLPTTLSSLTGQPVVSARTEEGYFWASDKTTLLAYLDQAMDTYESPVYVTRYQGGFRVEGMEGRQNGIE